MTQNKKRLPRSGQLIVEAYAIRQGAVAWPHEASIATGPSHCHSSAWIRRPRSSIFSAPRKAMFDARVVDERNEIDRGVATVACGAAAASNIVETEPWFSTDHAVCRLLGG
jgi:hypothetical protein